MLENDDAVPKTAGQESESGARDRRTANRHALLIRSAKLIINGTEFLCILCDASDSGAKVRFFHPLPRSGRLILELQNEDRIDAEMVWTRGDKAGLRFIEKTRLARIIETKTGFQKRPVRVRVDVPAIIQAGGVEAECSILDISQQGAKLRCEHPLAIRQSIQLKAVGVPLTVSAKVCWRRKGMVGLSFETVFQFFELARTVYAMQGGDLSKLEFLGAS